MSRRAATAMCIDIHIWRALPNLVQTSILIKLHILTCQKCLLSRLKQAKDRWGGGDVGDEAREEGVEAGQVPTGLFPGKKI